MQSKIVAVVDDDPSMRAALVCLLRARGFEPAAYDSAEAFWADHALSKAFCVLLDVNLPGMSGIALRHRLSEAKSPLPVIFMTGDGEEPTRSTATAAGCVAYLRKPFPPQMLIDAIEKTTKPTSSPSEGVNS